MEYGPKEWDEHYRSNAYVYGKKPNLFLRQNVSQIPKGNILCVADGEGRNGVWLAKQGYRVTSIDFSPKAVEKIDALAQENDVSINTFCANLLNYDFGENEYDGIISIFSHFNIDDTDKLHSKYFNALKLDGVFLMESFAKEQLPLNTGGPKDIQLLYNIADIKNSFPNGYIELLKKDIVYLHEGNAHDGKAVVVRAIIKKSSD